MRRDMEEAQQHELQKRLKDMKDAAEVQKNLKEMKDALAKVDKALDDNPRMTEQAWVDLLEKKMSSFGNSFTAFDDSLNGAGRIPSPPFFGATRPGTPLSSSDSHLDSDINSVLDAIDAALAPSGEARQTLGGLVSHCRVDGTVMRDPGDLDGDGMVIVPISITLT